MTRPSAWHTLGRALGMVAALPAQAVGYAIAHRLQVIPLLTKGTPMTAHTIGSLTQQVRKPL